MVDIHRDVTSSNYADNAGRAAGLPVDGLLTISSAAAAWHAFLLRKAAQRVTELASARLNPLGLTLRHFGVLSAVEDEPGQNQRGIGERLRIDRTTVVALTDDLEEAGLLERRRGVDRRTFALYLTQPGVSRLDELKQTIASVHDEFLAPLSPGERVMLRELLIKLTGDGRPE